MLVTPAVAQIVVADTITSGGTLGFATATPSTTIADAFSLPPLTSGHRYQIDSIDFGIYKRAGTGTVVNAGARVRLFAASTGALSGSSPVFSDLRSDTSMSIGTLGFTSQATLFPLQMVYGIGSQPLLPVNGTTLGLVFTGLAGTNPSSSLTFALVNAPSSIAGSSSNNGYYRNVLNDGTIIGSDARTVAGWTNANVWVRVTATRIVPEPTTLMVLGLGLFFRRHVRSTRGVTSSEP